MRLAALSAAQRPARGQAPSAQPRLLGNISTGRKQARPPGLRQVLFEAWLADPEQTGPFVYHKGSLAIDVAHDPDLASLAARLRALSCGYFEEISPCGHCRGTVIGSGQLELATRRERGEVVYLATKR